MPGLSLAPFDAVDYLRDNAAMAVFLSAALENGDPEVFLQAVRTTARARDMSRLARDSGLSRESLYKALVPGTKPRYDTMLKLVQALGVQ